MNSKRLTLQQTIATAILLIGTIGIALVLMTDYTYRKLAYEQQQESVSKLIAIKSADLIAKLSERQKDLGLRLQNESGFKEAFDSNNKDDIVYWLDQEFNRYYVTIGLVKLEKIIIYDNNFKPITYSDRGFDIKKSGTLPCAQIINRVKALSDIERMKPSSHLCKYNNRPYYSTVVSIGSLKPQGYLQIITNPVHILTQIETELGIPLKIYNINQDLLHQSVNWPVKTEKQDHLISTYTLADDKNEAFITISGTSDITAFKDHLNSIRYKVVVGASTLTLLTLLIALFILHRGLLPLKSLRHAAYCSARGEFTSVNETGYNEISTPIHAFNLMVRKIQSLIDDLTAEVDGHTQTEEKYKKATEEAQKHAAFAEHQSNFLQMTLQSIIDGVITTTIDGYIKSMNPMAEQLTGWTELEARGKPLVQVMHVLQEETLSRIYDPIENIEHKSVLDEPINAILIQNSSNIETPVEYRRYRDHYPRRISTALFE
jgi:PAS domain-containing protein